MSDPLKFLFFYFKLIYIHYTADQNVIQYFPEFLRYNLKNLLIPTNTTSHITCSKNQ